MEDFDYGKAVGRLEEIEKKVQDPSVPLQEMDVLLKEAAGLIGACRQYLRTARQKFSGDL